MEGSDRRLYLAVAACAVVVHLGALWNSFAMDDLHIIAANPLVHSFDGVWRAFAAPYWPPELGGHMYRPLPIATYAFDRLVNGPGWFHAVNLLWHAGVSVAVAALARRVGGRGGGGGGAGASLVAGLLFAVHPVHVEAIANVVGRAELMAAAGVCLAVYAAVARGSIGWSLLALAGGLLSKESAAVAPLLVVWAWAVGIGRPSQRRMAAFAVGWVLVGSAYLALRWAVLHPYARFESLAPVFVGESGTAVRVTAIAALADIARLLLFPLTLRVDYGPAERTVARSLVDGRFLLGLLCVAAWAALLVLAWRRGRRVEAYGLGWIAIALLPVANLLFPIGVLVAERTLYLPSAGLAIAAGAALVRLPIRARTAAVAALVVACAVRSAVRVPVWKADPAVTLSILEDSPASYRGPARVGALYQRQRQPARALGAYARALQIFDRDPVLLMSAADAALTLRRPGLADSLLLRTERLCSRCLGLYRSQARAALSRGDTAVADSLIARWERGPSP